MSTSTKPDASIYDKQKDPVLENRKHHASKPHWSSHVSITVPAIVTSLSFIGALLNISGFVILIVGKFRTPIDSLFAIVNQYYVMFMLSAIFSILVWVTTFSSTLRVVRRPYTSPVIIGALAIIMLALFFYFLTCSVFAIRTLINWNNFYPSCSASEARFKASFCRLVQIGLILLCVGNIAETLACFGKMFWSAIHGARLFGPRELPEEKESLLKYERIP